MRSRIGVVALILVSVIVVSCKSIAENQQTYKFPAALIVSSSPPSVDIETGTEIAEMEEKTGAEEVEIVEIVDKSSDEIVQEPTEKAEVLPMTEQEIMLKDAKDKHNITVDNKDIERFDEAIEACRSAVKMKPEHVDAYYKLGSMYTELGMYNEAIEAYEKYIDLVPDNAEVYYNLGITYLMIDNSDAAFEKYEKLNKKEPELAERLYSAIVQNVLVNNEGVYFVQVAAFKNKGYALEMTQKMKDLYKYVYIKKENNFNKVRIIGINTVYEGEKVKKELRARLKLEPLLKKG